MPLSHKLPCISSLTRHRRASGLGRATILELVKNGGNAAILDMNAEQGEAFAKELGSSARFWVCDVSDTDSIAAAVKGIVEWVHQTGAPLGGIIPAAGVGNPALVGLWPPSLIQERTTSYSR
jgi:NAD(P)-dependent dehydrogenase (short-subunit alcohol dehydrogenase family)